MSNNKFFLTALLILIGSVNSLKVFSPSELNNISLRARRFDACRELDPEGCCFQGNVVLTVNYDDNNINSFTFTGTQVGKNCDGTMTVYSTKYSSTLKNVQQGFSVTDKNVKSFSYTFYTGYREYTEKDNLMAEVEFTARNPPVGLGSTEQFFMYNFIIGKKPQEDSDQSNNGDNNNNKSDKGVPSSSNLNKICLISIIMACLIV